MEPSISRPGKLYDDTRRVKFTKSLKPEGRLIRNWLPILQLFAGKVFAVNCSLVASTREKYQEDWIGLVTVMS